MGSITSLNEERNRQLREQEKEKREIENNFPKNRIKQLVFCAFCGSVASFFATRKSDAKKIPCCQICAPSTAKKAPWILSIEQI